MQNLCATVPMFGPLVVIFFFLIIYRTSFFATGDHIFFFVLSLCVCKMPHLLYGLPLSDCREHYVHLQSSFSGLPEQVDFSFCAVNSILQSPCGIRSTHFSKYSLSCIGEPRTRLRVRLAKYLFQKKITLILKIFRQ